MDDRVKTFLGKNIPDQVLGIVYLCDYNSREETIKVTKEVMFDNARRAMDFYANTPNPESHVVVGRNQNHIHKEVKQLNSLLKNKEYLKQLKEYI